MLWVNFLHFYQPPTASDEQIKDIAKSSYEPWADFLWQHKKVKVTINFTACLTERLFLLGYDKLLKKFSHLADRGQVEFVESAAFHPILPLLPDKEIIKQIKINHSINRRRFGSVYRPRGFFLPEMAYSQRVAGIINYLKYQYLILDQISLDGTTKNKIDSDYKYQIKGTNLFVVFRDRFISQSFVPHDLIDLVSTDKTIITATDGELYGHRYWNWWPPYLHIINNKKVTTKTISEYLRGLRATKNISPVSSSWESSEEEIKKGIPFALWYDLKNNIHKSLWQLANFVLELNYNHSEDPDHFSSRLHLEKGLASCTFWWASGRDFQLFGSPAWNPEEIEKGALELLRSVRTLREVDANIKIKAEKMFLDIHGSIWSKHWKQNNKN
ncbi:hypothetical protein GYA54_03960 [Candidatus Kuenenbacteria bacterium]|nr:hypothetical protein [Candidatus Kuenenbacteria bacterium]